MSLSFYRIHRTAEMKALFITLATINSIYSSIWDVLIDWSLGDPYARYPLLRNVLGFKWLWLYYVAMILDPVLRLSWIFYIIYGDVNNHSTTASFFIALAEVLRRIMWTLLRIENEHCANVGNFRASRDIALPYDISPSLHSTPSGPDPPIPKSSQLTNKISSQSLGGETLSETLHMPSASIHPTSISVARTGWPLPDSCCPDLEAARDHKDAAAAGGSNPVLDSMRHRRPSLRRGVAYRGQPPRLQGLGRMGNYIYNAHGQDCERRRDIAQQGDEVKEEREESGSPEDGEQ